MGSSESNSKNLALRSLAELLKFQAEARPDQTAIIFHDDSSETSLLTYKDLLDRSQRIANTLKDHFAAGSKALLLYPPGLDFLIGFCGCSLAGMTPVPTCYPKPGRAMKRLDAIARSSNPSVVLSTEMTFDQSNPAVWDPAAANLPRLATDRVHLEIYHASTQPTDESETASLHQDLALLQFTSGSTSEPKGVMVTHQNLMANLEAIRQGFGIEFEGDRTGSQQTIVSWLPAFHDMGLIGGLLLPLYVGVQVVTFSPRSFLSRPLRWLQLVSQYRATVTGAPNFAYQLCVERIDGFQAEGLDLSSLEVAFCGAEPINPRSLEQFASRFAHTGFNPNTFLPCYGLAEATLFVAGSRLGDKEGIISVDRSALTKGKIQVVASNHLGRQDDVVRLVSSGSPAIHTQLRIVDPDTSSVLPEGTVGEIWLQGNSIAGGYLNPGCTSNPFGQALANADNQSGRFLKTGDLGFLLNGKLFVTGRVKDVIILRGRNHYPQDIEASIKSATQKLLGQVVAVSDAGPNGESFAIVAEMARTTPGDQIPEIIRRIRRSVIEEHEIDPRRVILVRTASIPVTTSGKLQRSATRDLMNSESLIVRGSWYRSDVRVDGEPLPIPELPSSPSVGQKTQIADSIERWMLSWLMVRGGVEAAELDAEKSLDQLGLDSLSAVEMSGEIEDWLGLRLTPIVAYEHPTPRKLADHLAEQWLTK